MVFEPVVLAVIAVIGLISYQAFNNPELKYRLIFYPYRIKETGEYFRFLTSGFIHGDMQHLLFNMFSFYFFGISLLYEFATASGSYTTGAIKMLIVFLGGIIASDIYSYFKHKDNPNYMALGASGGVSAVIFGSIVFSPFSTIWLFFIPMPAILFAVGYLFYSARMAKQGTDNIGHDAHFFGAIFGVVITLILEPSSFGTFINGLMNPHW